MRRRVGREEENGRMTGEERSSGRWEEWETGGGTRRREMGGDKRRREEKRKMGRWGDSKGDGKIRREWEKIRGEEWSNGRWEDGETVRGMGR